VVFPDVKRIEKLMLNELSGKKLEKPSNHDSEKERTPFNDLLVQMTRAEQARETGIGKKAKDNEPER
jgi:hypothetical protein